MFSIVTYLYGPDGALMLHNEQSSYLEPAWTNSCHFGRWAGPRDWPGGEFRVSVFVDGVKVAAGSFVINTPPDPAVADVPAEPSGVDVSAAPVENRLEPAPPPVPKSVPTVEDCVKERRLTSLRTLDSIESWTLDKVKGSCEALNLPLREEQPTRPPTGSEWHRFGEDQGRSQTNQPPSVEEARVLRRVSPSYPALAKQARIQGIVRLSAVVGVDGKLHNIRVISGSSLLSGAAVAAAEQWRYSPARLHGNVVESQATIDINFTLDN
jgi:TonB family protein